MDCLLQGGFNHRLLSISITFSIIPLSQFGLRLVELLHIQIYADMAVDFYPT